MGDGGMQSGHAIGWPDGATINMCAAASCLSFCSRLRLRGRKMARTGRRGAMIPAASRTRRGSRWLTAWQRERFHGLSRVALLRMVWFLVWRQRNSRSRFRTISFKGFARWLQPGRRRACQDSCSTPSASRSSMRPVGKKCCKMRFSRRVVRSRRKSGGGPMRSFPAGG